MAHATPCVRNGTLLLEQDAHSKSIVVGDASWWQWLDSQCNGTFRFEGPEGSFTARHEQKRGGRYWYVYRRQQGRLKKVYLGKSEELTLARLSAAALELARHHSSVTTSEHVKTEQQTLEREHLLATEMIHYSSQGILLTTKLSPPLVRSNAVPRERLIEQMNAALHHRLLLISAPAGFGKTTLLSSWYSRLHHTSLACAWISLERADNDLTRFWSYIAAALGSVSPRVAEHLLPLLQTGSLGGDDDIVTLLINDLALHNGEIILILDDYQVITAQAIHRAFTYLLDHLPAHVHIVLASRSEPPLPLYSWRAKDYLYELHAPDLRFTRQEAALFLRTCMQLDLPTDDLALLDERTEGWVAGLQLMALSLKGQQKIASSVPSISNTHRYVLDYLINEVLCQQPRRIQEFLLHTSLLGKMNASLCNTLMQQSDSQEILEQIEGANLFLLSLDEQHRWYRYHHLFAESLRERLQQIQPDIVPLLHSRASMWYEQHGLLTEAVEHASMAGNSEELAAMIERNAQHMMMLGQVTTFLHWLTLLPEQVEQAHPRLALFHAGALIAIGQLDAAEELIHAVESRFRGSAMEPGEQGSAGGVSGGELASCRTALAAFRGDLSSTIEYAQRALELLPKADTFSRSLVAASLGTAYLLEGEPSKAMDAYAEAVAAGQKAHNVHAALASEAAQGFLQAGQGKLHFAAQTYKRLIQWCHEAGGEKRLPVVSMAYVYLGELLYQWNDLEQAEQHTRRGIELGEQWGYIGILAWGYCVLARIRLARGAPEEALRIIQSTEQRATSYTITLITTMTAACRALIQLRLGDLTAAAQWAQASGLSEEDAFTYPKELEHLVLARVLLAQERLPTALSLIEKLLLTAGAAGRERTLVEALVIQALARQRQGDKRLAMDSLTQALTLAEPERYIRIFIEEAPAITPLLHALLAKGVTPRYTRQLLASLGEIEEHAGVTVLSERELDILHQIVAGRSNREIAEHLVIANSTVKTHINHIYTKLGVHNRVQAVARAQALQLL